MKTKKAGAETPAIRNKRHSRPYLKSTPLSSLKIQLGELLLYMQRPLNETDRQIYWRQFELSLRQYLDLKGCR